MAIKGVWRIERWHCARAWGGAGVREGVGWRRARRTCRLEHLLQLRLEVIVRSRRGRIMLVRNLLDHPPPLNRLRKLLLERGLGLLAALRVLEVMLAQRLLVRLRLLA